MRTAAEEGRVSPVVFGEESHFVLMKSTFHHPSLRVNTIELVVNRSEVRKYKCSPPLTKGPSQTVSFELDTLWAVISVRRSGVRVDFRSTKVPVLSRSERRLWGGRDRLQTVNVAGPEFDQRSGASTRWVTSRPRERRTVQPFESQTAARRFRHRDGRHWKVDGLPTRRRPTRGPGLTPTTRPDSVKPGGLCVAKLTGPGPVFAFEWLMASRRWQSVRDAVADGAAAARGDMIVRSGTRGRRRVRSPGRRRSARSSTCGRR